MELWQCMLILCTLNPFKSQSFCQVILAIFEQQKIYKIKYKISWDWNLKWRTNQSSKPNKIGEIN